MKVNQLLDGVNIGRKLLPEFLLMLKKDIIDNLIILDKPKVTNKVIEIGDKLSRIAPFYVKKFAEGESKRSLQASFVREELRKFNLHVPQLLQLATERNLHLYLPPSIVTDIKSLAQQNYEFSTKMRWDYPVLNLLSGRITMPAISRRDWSYLEKGVAYINENKTYNEMGWPKLFHGDLHHNLSFFLNRGRHHFSLIDFEPIGKFSFGDARVLPPFAANQGVKGHEFILTDQDTLKFFFDVLKRKGMVQKDTSFSAVKI